VIFVDRFAVEDGLHGSALVVLAGLVVPAGELGDMAVLAHVEVEPWLVMEPGRGPSAARRMVGDEMRAAIAGAQAFRHRPRDFPVRVAFDWTIAADDPDDARVAVTLPQPFAVHTRVRRREDLGPHAPLPVPLVAPGREHADIEAHGIGALHDPVHVREVVLVRLRRIVVPERRVSVRIGIVQAVELGEDYGLDDGEAPFRAIAQIALRVLAGQTVEQLPGCVAQPEERLARGGDEEALVLRDLQSRQLPGGRGGRERQQDGDRGGTSHGSHRASL